MHQFYKIAHGLIKLALIWIFILLNNATDEKDIWKVRRLQTINIALLWIGSWLYDKAKNTGSAANVEQGET